MKKIGLVLLIIASIGFVSCGERYEEERGAVFEGTWRIFESYVDAVPNNNAYFFVARELEGEKVLLFYSKGRYDSSFVYRFQNNNLYVNRILDSVKVIEYYLLSDSGDTIKSLSNYPIIYRASTDLVNYPNSVDKWKSIEEELKSSGKKYQIIDTVIEVQKPEYPHIGNYSEERYYGTYSINEGAQLRLTIDRYFVDNAGAPTNKLYGRDIYERPEEVE
jgi:hypothetical protein